jgi:hypothetical protein
MKKLLCFLGVHDWKWEPSYAVKSQVVECGEKWTGNYVYQNGTCAVCQIAKMRRVR